MFVVSLAGTSWESHLSKGEIGGLIRVGSGSRFCVRVSLKKWEHKKTEILVFLVCCWDEAMFYGHDRF